MYKVVGVMSGTSLDGLDLCLCNFEIDGKKWQYKIIKTYILPYTKEWRNKLGEANLLKAEDLLILDMEFGNLIGKTVKNFIEDEKVDLICSHGHTVFHQPKKKLTLQIGNGSAISTTTGITTINDFRKLDVLLGGQGAPLVPIGDSLLFNRYEACINLGGFSNISFNKNGERIAYDICPVNIVLNYLCNKINLEYDNNGEKASLGKMDAELLAELNKLEFYSLKPPKSLGREWVESNLFPLLVNSNATVQDLLRTFVEHISSQIAKSINEQNLNDKILFTGGGTKNTFLIQRIIAKANCKVIVPHVELVDFKEALIFGFLGVLCFRHETNTLNSVTGAIRDSCGGTIHYPF